MSTVWGAIKAVLHSPFSLFRWLLEMNPWARWYASYLLWWPTLAVNRATYVLVPWWRAMFNTVDDEHGLILGAVPLFRSDVTHLHKDHGVAAVLNMCSEWEDHLDLYASLGIRYHRERVVDFTVPTREQLLRCARFIEECVSEGRTVYCHCKAGRGRSTCAYLAWYVVFRGIDPAMAWTAMKKKRRHISKKHLAAGIQSLWADVSKGGITPEDVRAGRFTAAVRPRAADSTTVGAIVLP